MLRAAAGGNARCAAMASLLLVCVPVSRGQDDRISVDVNLVVLHATVTDQHGRLVSDLGEQDFQVYENGVRQQIKLFKHEDVPVTAGLLVDHSGSMKSKLVEVSAAARAFVQASNPDDEMFVINFNEHVEFGLPDSIRFTSDPAKLEAAISRVPATGMTALYDAIAVALRRLQSGSREKKVLLGVSDGGDNASVHETPPDSEARRAIERNFLYSRDLRRKRYRPKSGGSQKAGGSDRRDCLLSERTERSHRYLHAHREGYSKSVHHRLRSG